VTSSAAWVEAEPDASTPRTPEDRARLYPLDALTRHVADLTRAVQKAVKGAPALPFEIEWEVTGRETWCESEPGATCGGRGCRVCCEEVDDGR